uniref:Uncharacterized protein n=1 Tax=Populus trichocarpa TaxID=3694 RepID=A0A3N7H350_POPTR
MFLMMFYGSYMVCFCLSFVLSVLSLILFCCLLNWVCWVVFLKRFCFERIFVLGYVLFATRLTLCISLSPSL